MKNLIYIKDTARLEMVGLHHKQCLSKGWTVITDCPHVHYSVLCNYPADSVFMGEYFTAEDFDKVEGRLRIIREIWPARVRDRLNFKGINLTEMINLEHSSFFRQSMMCGLMISRIIDMYSPDNILIAGPDEVPCWAGDRANNNNSVMLGMIQYESNRRRINVRALDYKPGPGAVSVKVEQDDSGRVFCFDAWQEKDSVRLVAVAGGFHLKVLNPIVQHWDSRKGFEGLLLNIGKAVPATNYRSGMSSSDRIRFASISDLSCNPADPEYQKMMQSIVESAKIWDRQRQLIEFPEITANPYLNFQWNFLWNSMVQLPGQIQIAAEAMRVLEPDVVMTDEMVQANIRIFTEVAKQKNIMTVQCPHGYVADIEEFQPQGDLFLAWGREGVYQINKRFTENKTPIEVTGSPVTEQTVSGPNKISRQELINTIGLDPSKKTVCVITSGIFSNVCPARWQEFIEKTDQIKALAGNDGIQVIVKTNPRTDHYELYREIFKEYSNVKVITAPAIDELSSVIDIAVSMYYIGTATIMLMHKGIPTLVYPNKNVVWHPDMRWRAITDDKPINIRCIELLNDDHKRRAYIDGQKAFVGKHLDIEEASSAQRSVDAIVEYINAGNIKPAGASFRIENYQPSKSRKIGKLAIVAPQIGNVSETFITRQVANLCPERTVLITREVQDKAFESIPTLLIGITTGPKIFNEDTEQKVLSFLREHNVSHILCQYGCYEGDIIELNRRTLNLPIFVHFHGGDVTQMPRDPVFVRYYRWMSRYVTGIIAVSNKMKETLSGYGIEQDKIRVIPYSVEIPEKPEVTPESEPCRFFSVIRLVAKKAPILLLKAFEIVHRQMPSCTLDIIGDGVLRKEVEDFIVSHDLSGSVRLHGAQRYSYTKQLRKTACVYVQHSITDPVTGDAEGLPNTILEAGAAGLPVVSTVHQGIPDEVDHGVTGWLVEEGDYEKMAEYMLQLAGDADLRKRMGLAGREKMKKNFELSLWMKRLNLFLTSQEFEEPGLNTNNTASKNLKIESDSLNLINSESQPFSGKSNRALVSTDSGSQSGQGIIKVLTGMGYEVDMIDSQDMSFSSDAVYDLFVGCGSSNWEYLRRNAAEDAIKIFLSDNIYWSEHNRRHAWRYSEFTRRTGCSLPHDNWLNISDEFALNDADGVICLGNRICADSYSRFPVVLNTQKSVCADDHFDPETKDYEEGRRHFLFYGSRSNIHEGLDLIMESFAEIPDAHLWVAGPIDSRLVEIYADKLNNCGNIHMVGEIEYRSAFFYELMNRCNCVIAASCGEGSNAEVLECINQGLIPVVTDYTCIDVNDYGVIIRDESVKQIASTVREISQKPGNWHKENSKKAHLAASIEYSNERFTENFKHSIEIILNQVPQVRSKRHQQTLQIDSGLQNYLGNYSDDLGALLRCAQYLLSQKKDDHAAKLLRQAMRLEPKSFTAPCELARYMSDYGDIDKALGLIAVAVQMCPSDNRCREIYKYIDDKSRDKKVPGPQAVKAGRPKYDDLPVAVVCYNRPYHLKQVLDSLREHRITNLYIFCDGPRDIQDSQNVSHVRKIVKQIDWTVPKVFMNDKNQGLAKAVTTAADTVLAENDRLVLLEDDCIPKKNYFDFVVKCLDRYENNEKVFGICGYSVPIPDRLRKEYPYDMFFYPRIGSCGWATWKRAWKCFDSDLKGLYEKCRNRNIDMLQGGLDIPGNVERVLNSSTRDVWTLNWVLSVYLHGGCYIYPATSQIHNIGFDGSGIHCGRSKSKFDHNPPDRRIERYPEDVFYHKPLVEYYNGFYNPRPKVEVKAGAGKPDTTADLKKISIVHINTHDIIGGAAKVAWRLAEHQNMTGHKSIILSGYKKSTSGLSMSFDPAPDRKLYDQCIKKGLLDYHLQGSHTLIRNPFIQNADLLHLHNLHGNYFNPFTLPRLSQEKPVVWTLHDMAAITGHCAHSFECSGWQHGCTDCPHLDYEHKIIVDGSGRMMRDKKNIYDHSMLQLVCPSRWLMNKVRKSILKDHPVVHIPNSVDTDVFQPYDKSIIRKQLNISEDSFVIGAVAHGGALGNHWKGGSYTQQAIEVLFRQIPNSVFLNIGSRQTSGDRRIINVGYIEDEATLAAVYSALDVFMYTPVADNCPLVVLEALACGVPIVSFNTGGIPELVMDGQNGIITDYKDTGQVINAVTQLWRNGTRRRETSMANRLRAIENYDHKVICNHYEKCYRAVLEQVQDKKPAPLPPGSVPAIVKTKAFCDIYGCDSENSDRTGKMEKSSDYMIDVSFVLATKNRAPLLDKMISSLKDSIGSVKCELIVIDGGSTDNTLDVLKSHGIANVYQEHDVFVPGRHSWPELYNFGLSRAKGRYAMYLSDDIVFQGRSVEKAVTQLDNQDDSVAGGIFFYKNTHARPGWDRFGIDFTYGSKLLMNYGLFRTDLFRKVGPLDTSYRFYCADGDLCYRFYHDSKQLIPLSECFVVHDNVLDVQKQSNADRSAADIARYKARWSGFVSTDKIEPRRLYWQDELSHTFRITAEIKNVNESIEHFWTGLAWIQNDRPAMAKEEFEKCVKKGCDHWEILWSSVYACHHSGDIKTAVDYAGRALAKKPGLEAAKQYIENMSGRIKPKDTDIEYGNTLKVLSSKNLYSQDRPLRLHLGCGKWNFPGYVNIDYPPVEHTTAKNKLGADYFADITRLRFPDRSVDEIRLHHVFEHFNRVKALEMIIRWHAWLRENGVLRIETPDLEGSARTILSPETSWDTKMAVVRHLAGDQAAKWAYHYDHWFGDRFEHTLSAFGFENIRIKNTQWEKPPYLSNVEVTAEKVYSRTINEQLEAAGRILRESTVAEKERPMWDIWMRQLKESLSDCVAGQGSNKSYEIMAGI